jgi:hypothetical protein
MTNWRKMGRHLVADWDAGSMQVVRDDKDGQKSFKYAVFEHGAIIAQGREPTLAAAQRKSVSALPQS